VNLRLILVSGKTEDFTFSPSDSATDIAKHVFDNWPAGKRFALIFKVRGKTMAMPISTL